jgi:hypothetical protein
MYIHASCLLKYCRIVTGIILCIFSILNLHKTGCVCSTDCSLEAPVAEVEVTKNEYQ